MKINKKEVEKLTKYTQTEKVICDLCKREYKNDSRWTLLEDNFYGDFEQKKTNLSYKWGDYFPDGGSGYEIGIDICPDCFMSKLVPWLKSQGVIIEEKEWDY